MNDENNRRLITIRSTAGSIELLRNDLEEAIGPDPDVYLKVVRPDMAKDRTALDVAVIVAAIGAAGAGLSNVIKGVFSLLTAKEKIILRGKDGRTIEVPADTSDERLRELIDMAKALDIDEITMIQP